MSNIIGELKSYEQEQHELFLKEKSIFEDKLKQEQKRLLEKNEMELFERRSHKHDILEKARKDAKEQAHQYVKAYQDKIRQVENIPQDKRSAAADIIISHFLSQDV